jgi:hypothetical protein
MPSSATHEWVLPRILTSAEVEAQMDREAPDQLVVAGVPLRSGPAAEARILSWLDALRSDGHVVDARLRYVLADSSMASQGWGEVIERPLVHLLAQYSRRVLDEAKEDVTSVVRSEQARHRGYAGLVTRTGGQTTILDFNSRLATGLSRTLFAEQSPLRIQAMLRSYARGRGSLAVGSEIVSYIAEAIENVRDHALRSADRSTRGLCLFVLKRTNFGQFPGLRAELPTDSPLRGYLDALEVRPGRNVDGLVEITIADSGPGVAFSLLGRPDLSIDDERDALLRAFQPGVSRKHRPGRGHGLTQMLAAVSNVGGIISVRSGRWSLHRDFTRRGAQPAMPDWVVVQRPFAVGTAITIVFPTSS